MRSNPNAIFDIPLTPVYFHPRERVVIDAAIAEVRRETDSGQPGEFPISDGRALELLCADWLARWGTP